ncbi:hypothetical protein COC42_17040 [Sphingomonas spermidinifaciens]|uniref:Uncharacterized protein n=1 Tax=Sphingomonas spermidinifaciens TaxID=1141889 RepID=A0A2A4B2A0_9SPHN|nr:hypothetical protein [Sphingomonas spermidinifaciens]PCD01804.1 hypothetical protein COC42_17040 [Sphingomonas spermidinifaciens]
MAVPARRPAAPNRIVPAEVLGWGVDAEPDNDPTWPMRDRAGDPGPHWPRPALQRTEVKILQSIEYARRPAVFGTAVPPRGLSGVVRRAAFRWSESSWLHWLLLMGADRVNVIEGVADDLAKARIPNIPAEMGARAEWAHNRGGLFRKIAVAGAAAAVIAAAIRRRRV